MATTRIYMFWVGEEPSPLDEILYVYVRLCSPQRNLADAEVKLQIMFSTLSCPSKSKIQGRIQDLRKEGAHAQLLYIIFARPRPLIAHARVSRGLLLLHVVGVVDVGCPVQFNICANV